MIVNQIKNEYICCICIQSCLISEKDIYTCRICKGGGTIVCGDCITQSLEYGQADLFKKCPVCRSENWSIYTSKIKKIKKIENNTIKCQLNINCNLNANLINDFFYFLRIILYTGVFFCVGMLTFYIAKREILTGDSLLVDIFLYILIGFIMTLLTIFILTCLTLLLISLKNSYNRNNIYI